MGLGEVKVWFIKLIDFLTTLRPINLVHNKFYYKKFWLP